MEGPDHCASLEPNELTQLVRSIRNIELAMGNGVKKATKSEQINKTIVRKSIAVKRVIKKGDVLSDKNLTTLRPASGISPIYWDKLIGSKAQKDYMPGELLTENFEE